MPMKVTWRSLGLIGLLGGLGGAVNAWLCFAKLPAPIMSAVNIDGPSVMQFRWPIIPEGAAHGALLAIISVQAAAWFSHVPHVLRWLLLPVLGWIAGWISWMPIMLPGGIQDNLNILQIVGWPLTMDYGRFSAFWIPYLYFGLVGLLHTMLLLLWRRRVAAGSLRFLLSGIASGVVGSLWWWISWGRWYFALIHGAMWGSLVGFGVWKAQGFTPHVSHLSPDSV